MKCSTNFRLPLQVASLTLGCRVSPILEQADLPEVPAFTAVHDEHFNPKCDSHPRASSPRRTVAMAVLGRQNYSKYKSWWNFW